MTRPDAGRMYRSVTETLRSCPDDPELAGLRQMAREYARLLDAAVSTGDGAGAYHKLGPRLQAVLRELAGHARRKRADAPAVLPANVTRLRGSARDRKHGAAAVDPAAP